MEAKKKVNVRRIGSEARAKLIEKMIKQEEKAVGFRLTRGNYYVNPTCGCAINLASRAVSCAADEHRPKTSDDMRAILLAWGVAKVEILELEVGFEWAGAKVGCQPPPRTKNRPFFKLGRRLHKRATDPEGSTLPFFVLNALRRPGRVIPGLYNSPLMISRDLPQRLRLKPPTGDC